MPADTSTLHEHSTILPNPPSQQDASGSPSDRIEVPASPTPAPSVRGQLNTIEYIEKDDQYSSLAETIRSELEGPGYVVVRNFNIDPDNLEDCRSKYLDLAGKVGTPVAHDTNNSIIWDIRVNPGSKSFVKTYSEHSHEAEMHTDSQYSSYPEDYFGLLTLKPADCGGGESYLLGLDQVLESLREQSDATRLEHTLRHTDFPFIVPNVFKKNSSVEFEFNFGPVLRNNEIRFRVDTFEKALKACPDLCTEEQVSAFEVLKNIILKNSKILAFHLQARDLIFINNKTMLHGRSEFKDQSRHLLRIRLNRF
jgi:alpha-ketoglutarate-dependent taurine dioxygenase